MSSYIKKSLTGLLALMVIVSCAVNAKAARVDVKAEIALFDSILRDNTVRPKDWHHVDLGESFVILPPRFYSKFSLTHDAPTMQFSSDDFWADRVHSNILGYVEFQKLSQDQIAQVMSKDESVTECSADGFECMKVKPKTAGDGLVSSLLEQSRTTVLVREDLLIRVDDDNESLANFIAEFYLSNLR